MIRVGQVVPGIYPSFYTEGDVRKETAIRAKLRNRQRLTPWELTPVKATVEWVHPEGRYCVLRFQYTHPDRSFRECRALRRESK